MVKLTDLQTHKHDISLTQLLRFNWYLKLQKSHYLTSSVWPCYLIEDEGIGIQVPQTLSDVGPHTRTGAACNTHHGENPSQAITALHLHPNQILHSLFMTWSMNTEPSENNNKLTRDKHTFKAQTKSGPSYPFAQLFPEPCFWQKCALSPYLHLPDLEALAIAWEITLGSISTSIDRATSSVRHKHEEPNKYQILQWH